MIAKNLETEIIELNYPGNNSYKISLRICKIWKYAAHLFGNIDESDIESLKGKPCYYPFYKMFVDWNGDVLFCSNDWGKEIIVGNLVKDTLHNVWFSDKMYEIRKKLSVGNRNHSPCNKCSVNGQLFGKKSFDIINEYYENSNN